MATKTKPSLSPPKPQAVPRPQQEATTKRRHVIVVSDLHVGSTVALCPESYELDDGGLYCPSPNQVAVLALWRAFWRSWVPKVTGGDPYTVVVNGDALEGGHKHGTLACITQNMADQIKMSAELLQPIVDDVGPRNFHLIRGTEAHVGQSAQHEVQLAAILGVSCPWELMLRRGGCSVHFAHHIGCSSSGWTEGGYLVRELASAFLETGQWGVETPNLFVRSHRHRFYQVEAPSQDGTTGIITTPGWQLITPFGYRLGKALRPSQIGGICITMEDDGSWYTRKFVRSIQTTYAPVEKVAPYAD